MKGFIQPEIEEARKYKGVIQAGWHDVPHLDDAEKTALLATTPPYQREARSKGTPQLGAGAIYQITENELKVPPFDIPKHWSRAFGLDAGGGNNATAAVWGAVDRDSQTVYIYDVYKRESPETAVHLAAVQAQGRGFRVSATARRSS